jgi:mono/diheme cytochrome c family protein
MPFTTFRRRTDVEFASYSPPPEEGNTRHQTLERRGRGGQTLSLTIPSAPASEGEHFITRRSHPSSGGGEYRLMIVFVVLMMVVSAGCRQKMADQPRYDPYDKSTFFADMLSARPLPAGTVSRNTVSKNEMMDLGMTNGKPADRFPFPVTMDVLNRGRQRYDIYCVPCHGYTGTGDGMAARRGFRRPPASFHADELRNAPPGHFFDVITNGFGAMPSYAYQIDTRDRWAIIAYIRALQLSQWAAPNDVPPDEMQKLEATR